MNDNKKSVLEQALEAVQAACDYDDISDAELRHLLAEFKERLGEIDAIIARKKQSH